MSQVVFSPDSEVRWTNMSRTLRIPRHHRTTYRFSLSLLTLSGKLLSLYGRSTKAHRCLQTTIRPGEPLEPSIRLGWIVGLPSRREFPNTKTSKSVPPGAPPMLLSERRTLFLGSNFQAPTPRPRRGGAHHQEKSLRRSGCRPSPRLQPLAVLRADSQACQKLVFLPG